MVVAVSEIVGTSGVWQVDNAGLEAAIRRRVERGPDSTVKVTFEPNLIVSDGDRAKIFQLALSDILNDKRKVERLLGTPQFDRSVRQCGFPFAQVS